ncbi:hypothetical protein D3C75_1012090 [compost metagenome]
MDQMLQLILHYLFIRIFRDNHFIALIRIKGGQGLYNLGGQVKLCSQVFIHNIANDLEFMFNLVAITANDK